MLHKFGAFELDERRFELRRRGKPVAVQRKVLETIVHLVRHRDRLVSKDELIEGPWKGTNVSDASLARAVMIARKILAGKGDGARFIQTVRGKGYRFVAEVESEDLTGKSTAARKTARTAVEASIEPPPSSRTAGIVSFLGREAQLRTMLLASARACAGQGSLVLVSGEPGIGKTTLLERFGQGLTGEEALWGRCWEGGGAPAFWPWVEIVRGYVERHPEATSTIGSEIAHWLPEDRASPETLSRLADVDSPQARFRVFDCVSRFLQRATARRHLVVVIDDLHFADDASVLLLSFLSRTVERWRLALVVSYRTLEVRSRPILASFLGGPLPHAIKLELHGLVDTQIAALLAAQVGRPLPPALVRRVCKATDGNPFLAGEIGRTLTGNIERADFDFATLDSFRIPDRIADIVRRHLARLPASTVAALATGSILGREFSLPLLQSLSGAESHGLADIEPALIETIVYEVPGVPATYRFSHALIRETLYQNLPPSRRLVLHHAAAQLLEEQQRTDYETSFQIAHHYFTAAAHKGADKAVEWALIAAERARGLAAYELAADHCHRALMALELLPRDDSKVCEILLRLAEAQRLAGQATEALASFKKAEEIALSQKDGAAGARAVLGNVEVLRDAAPTDGSLEQRTRAALAMLPSSDHPLRARLLGALSLVSLLTDPLSTRRALCEEAIAMARRIRDADTLAFVLYSCHWTIHDGSDPTRGLELATEMIQAARISQNSDRWLDGLLWRAGHLLTLGRADAFDSTMQEHARMTEKLNHATHRWWDRLASCARAQIAAQWQRAEAVARDAFRLGEPIQGLVAESMLAIQLLIVSSEKEPSKLLRDMEPVLATARKCRQLIPGFQPWWPGLALAEAETGQLDEARAILDQYAAQGFDTIPDDQNRLPMLVMLGKLACALQDGPSARAIHDQLLAYAGLHVTAGLVAGYWGPVSHHLGALAATMGEPLAAQTHFEKAMMESRRLTAVGWTAWAELSCGTLTRDGRLLDPVRSRELVRRALATARELKLGRLAAKAGAALKNSELK